MSLHEQFIPGRWIDDIDVNDFVKLNKKPFLDKPIFLQYPFAFSGPIQTENWVKEDKKVDLSVSSFDSTDVNWFPLSTESSVMKRKIGFSENKDEYHQYYTCDATDTVDTTHRTTHHLYQEIATSDMNKMFRIGLFQKHPHNYSPMYVYPDIRIVPLYGTKEIIKEKRLFLNKMERFLQTTDWIQQRVAKNEEIKAIKQFEKFAKSIGVNVTKPASTTKEAIDILYVTLLSVVIENPSIPFSLTDMLTFIDVFAEKELLLKDIEEEDVQGWMDELVIKLMKIRFTPSPLFDESLPSSPFLFGETFGETVTKTTYRFLSSLERHYTSPFVIRVVWSEQLPHAFKNALFSLYQKGIPLHLVSPRAMQEKKHPALLPFGLYAETFHEIAFHGGGCDLEKAFYLALNGGKDVESNHNLSSISTSLRKDQATYEDVLKKFQDFLSFAILSYTEVMNALVYLNDIAGHHPFRSSLFSNQPFYSISFGFFHLKNVVKILAALQNEEAEWTWKEGKWVTHIAAPKNKYENEDVVMTHLISYIKRELKKIPLYKEAQHSVRFYADDLYTLTTPEAVDYELALPPEYMNGHFHANLYQVPLNEEFVKRAFAQNVTELNVSINPSFYMANGLLFHTDYHLKKSPLS